MSRNGDTDDKSREVLDAWHKDVNQGLDEANERIRRRIEEEQRKQK